MSVTDELWEYADECNGDLSIKLKSISNRIDMAVRDEYVKLPVDADGETWHIGDVTKNGMTVNSLMLNSHGWVFLGHRDIDPSIHRHYHEPTVEDVLREFFSRYVTTKPKEEDDAIVSEYAEKLREVVEHERNR